MFFLKHSSYIKKHSQLQPERCYWKRQLIATWTRVGKGVWGEEKAKWRRRPHKSHFPACPWGDMVGHIHERMGWIGKGFSIIMSRGHCEFHDETRHSISFRHTAKIPIWWCLIRGQRQREISALHPQTMYELQMSITHTKNITSSEVTHIRHTQYTTGFPLLWLFLVWASCFALFWQALAVLLWLGWDSQCRTG